MALYAAGDVASDLHQLGVAKVCAIAATAIHNSLPQMATVPDLFSSATHRSCAGRVPEL
jgi:hypothetical protein